MTIGSTTFCLQAQFCICFTPSSCTTEKGAGSREQGVGSSDE
ncbi:hypothetical protein [Chroococcidiopsis sp.]